MTNKPLLARALDPDNASILICGGAGVGMHSTKKLKDMGAWVYMMQRSDKLRSEIEEMMAVCVKGDALDVESVGKVMSGVSSSNACGYRYGCKLSLLQSENLQLKISRSGGLRELNYQIVGNLIYTQVRVISTPLDSDRLA